MSRPLRFTEGHILWESGETVEDGGRKRRAKRREKGRLAVDMDIRGYIHVWI